MSQDQQRGVNPVFGRHVNLRQTNCLKHFNPYQVVGNTEMDTNLLDQTPPGYLDMSRWVLASDQSLLGALDPQYVVCSPSVLKIRQFHLTLPNLFRREKHCKFWINALRMPLPQQTRRVLRCPRMISMSLRRCKENLPSTLHTRCRK